MQKTAEAVSVGHPDKTADYISSYILDRMLEQDKHVKYAVEVLIKNNTVVLAGEVSGNVNTNNLDTYVKQALSEIGYDEQYHAIWGKYTIDPAQINVINLISEQSVDINRGVQDNGWGDQGVFVGYACQGNRKINRELYLARKLNDELYNHAKKSHNLGIDIKTQITLNDNKIETVIVAIPMLQDQNLTELIIATLGEQPDKIIVNGTGRYTYHGAVADCGITGRKLACDFYSTASPIGGGNPWTNDATKSDLTLNIYARILACENLGDNDECTVYLSSCIGQTELPSGLIKTIKNGKTIYRDLQCRKTPDALIRTYGLNQPIYTNLCRCGISGILE